MACRCTADTDPSRKQRPHLHPLLFLSTSPTDSSDFYPIQTHTSAAAGNQCWWCFPGQGLSLLSLESFHEASQVLSSGSASKPHVKMPVMVCETFSLWKTDWALSVVENTLRSWLTKRERKGSIYWKTIREEGRAAWWVTGNGLCMMWQSPIIVSSQCFCVIFRHGNNCIISSSMTANLCIISLGESYFENGRKKISPGYLYYWWHLLCLPASFMTNVGLCVVCPLNHVSFKCYVPISLAWRIVGSLEIKSVTVCDHWFCNMIPQFNSMSMLKEPVSR